MKRPTRPADGRAMYVSKTKSQNILAQPRSLAGKTSSLSKAIADGFAKVMSDQIDANSTAGTSVKQPVKPAAPNVSAAVIAPAADSATKVATVSPKTAASVTPSVPEASSTPVAASALLGPFQPSANAQPAAVAAPVARATGQTTASGAPQIALAGSPGVTPATQNPYYGTNAPNAVTGYRKWFQADEGSLVARSSILPYCFAATQEGAQEALRLVQQFEPNATMQEVTLPGQTGGPGASAYAINLPNGRSLNAGLVLEMYYHQGWGVDGSSDANLRNDVVMPV